MSPQARIRFLVIFPLIATVSVNATGQGGPVNSHLMGYIDKTGEFVIAPQFFEAEGFAEGLAAVCQVNGPGCSWGYIDNKGKSVIAPQFTRAGRFVQGLAPVELGDKWGYIDKTGKFVITPQFSEAKDFAEGLAAVCQENDYNRRWGYIDNTGKFAITPQFSEAGSFAQGLAPVRGAKGGDWLKYGYIDKAGKFAITPQFYSAGEFAEGLAPAATERFKVGYIDNTGQFVIAPQFTYAWRFVQGLALVETSGRRGYIDRTGKFVLTAQFDWAATDFGEGLAGVGSGGRGGYIDNKGSFVIPPQFGRVETFAQGLAAAEAPPPVPKVDSPKVDLSRPRAAVYDRSLDANHDGVVDLEDVTLLMRQFNDLFETTIKPLLAKAGIDADKEVPKNVLERIRNSRLTYGDRAGLITALVQAEDLQKKVNAAMELFVPGSAELLRRLWELQRDPLAPKR